MATKKTLNMTFVMDNEKEHTISLSDPKDGITKTQVETLMNTIVEKEAIMKGTTIPESVKGAVIREVTETKIV